MTTEPRRRITIERFDQLEAKVDELLRLVRTLNAGASTYDYGSRVITDDERGTFLPGTGWLRDAAAEQRTPEALAVHAATARIDAILGIHTPVDEEAEVWPHHEGHDEMFPGCTVEDDCEGHLVTIQVCSECGYDHDGEQPLYRAWPCPTVKTAQGEAS